MAEDSAGSNDIDAEFIYQFSSYGMKKAVWNYTFDIRVLTGLFEACFNSLYARPRSLIEKDEFANMFDFVDSLNNLIIHRDCASP